MNVKLQNCSRRKELWLEKLDHLYVGILFFFETVTEDYIKEKKERITKGSKQTQPTIEEKNISYTRAILKEPPHENKMQKSYKVTAISVDDLPTPCLA